jgi:hypothetical protein
MGDDVTTRQLWPLLDPPLPESGHDKPSQLPEQPTDGLEPEDASDISVPGRAPWDTPERYTADELEALDDRPADMLETYDEMIRNVAPAVAAASVPAAQWPTSDPDDALAPVLDDVHERPRAAWPAWNSSEATSRDATPPADPFVKAVVAPHVFSTAADAPAEPLVLRLELATANEPNRDRSAETARPAGPWSDADVEGGPVDASDSEFAPRSVDADAFVEPDPPLDAEPQREPAADAPLPVTVTPATDPRPAWPPSDPIQRAEPPTEVRPYDPYQPTGAPASADSLATLPAATLASRLAQRASLPQPASSPQAAWVPERVSVLRATPVFEPAEVFDSAAPVQSAPARSSRRVRLAVAGLAVAVAVIAMVIVLTTSLLR